MIDAVFEKACRASPGRQHAQEKDTKRERGFCCGMMYVFICPKCGKSRMVSLQRKLKCMSCGASMANCEIDFSDWTQMDADKRKKIIYFYCHSKKDDLCFFRPMPFYDRWERNYFC